jgi:peptide/nickel transport system substrate-binding protein
MSGFALRAAVAISVAMVAAPAAGETPKRGGTLTFAVVAEPPGLDCHGSQTFALLNLVAPSYSLLVKFDSANDSAIVGDLAKSWTVSPDSLTYSFTLHSDVKFHDGSKLSSTDVKATFERLANPPEGVLSIRKSRFADIAQIETPDPATVVFKLKAPNASMLVNMASPFNCVYSAAKLKDNPKYPDTEIMGSGAFKFAEYVRGSHFVAKRFDAYFMEGQPYLDGFKAFFVKSSAVVPGMLGGQFDAEFRGQNPSERNQLLAKDKDRWVVHEGPWSSINTVFFNTTKKPFDDIRVRQALSLAIDRWGGSKSLEKISIAKYVGGLMRPGYEFALAEEELVKLPGFARDIEASRTQARRLLKEAGAEALTFKLLNRTLPEPYTPVGIFLIDQWRRVGLTVEHNPVEAKPYFDGLVSGGFDVALHPPSEPADDPSAQLAYFVSLSKSANSYSRIEDAKLDSLFDKQGRTLDPLQRKAIVNEFERYAITQAYSVPINWWQRIIVHNKKIKGWHMSPSHFQGQSLTTVWLDE